MSNEVNQFLSLIYLCISFRLLYILNISSNSTIIINIFKHIYQVSSSIIECVEESSYMENAFRKCQVMVKIFIQFFF